MTLSSVAHLYKKKVEHETVIIVKLFQVAWLSWWQQILPCTPRAMHGLQGERVL
jgi:hypothetical protein